MSSTIIDATAACRMLLRECGDIPALMQREWAELRLADFNLWDSGIGASAYDQASLDSRLSAKPEARDIIVNLLSLLQTLIEECQRLGQADSHEDTRSPSTLDDGQPRGRRDRLLPESQQHRSFSPWSDDSSSNSETATELEDFSSSNPLCKALRDVEVILDHLGRIAAIIRQSGSRFRLKKADQLFRIEDHKDLEAHLTAVALARTPFSQAEIDPSKLNEVQRRLINCNLKRRNRFLYAQKHSRHLGPQQLTDDDTNQVADLEEASSISNSENLQERARGGGEPRSLEALVPGGAEQTQIASAKSMTTATEVSALTLPKNPVPLQTATTRLSVTTTKVTYPRAPKISLGKLFFRCPCCCQTLPVATSKGSKWRKHLVGDLCPYTCVLEDCQEPEILYVTKEAWMKHLNEGHQKSQYWICLACSGSKTLETFDQEDAFTAHTRDTHSDTVRDDDIPILLTVCKRIVPMGIVACPLCDFPNAEDGNVEKEVLINHVAEHVHSFSLRALPWPPDEELEGDEVLNSSLDEEIRKWVHGLPKSGHGDVGEPSQARASETKIRDSLHYFKHNPYFDESSTSRGLSRTDSSSSKGSDLVNFEDDDDDVPMILTENLSADEVVSWPPFKTWLATLRLSLALQKVVDHRFHSKPFFLRGIRVLSVDFFRPGMIDILQVVADIINEDGIALPGIVYLRRTNNVALLMILRLKYNRDEKWVIVVEQPQISAGSLCFSGIPTGHLDDSGRFSGGHATAIREKAGISLEYNDLIDMNLLASMQNSTVQEPLEQATYLSPGCLDEWVSLHLWEKEITRRDLDVLADKIAGSEIQGERIIVRLCTYDSLLCGKDGRTMAAMGLYMLLTRAQLIP